MCIKINFTHFVEICVLLFKKNIENITAPRIWSANCCESHL